MKTYTIVYNTSDLEVLTHTLQADNEPEAWLAFERDNVGVEILHVIEHHVPKVCVALNGDMVESAASDGAVELLHVYVDSGSVEHGLNTNGKLMPSCRQAENLPHKQDDAHGFALVRLAHLPEEVRFDHAFVNDEERIREFTNAVQEELAS